MSKYLYVFHNTAQQLLNGKCTSHYCSSNAGTHKFIWTIYIYKSEKNMSDVVEKHAVAKSIIHVNKTQKYRRK